MTKRHELTALDAVRLLCNTIQSVQYLDKEGEGITPTCKDTGEYILQAALEYLAYGDTAGARDLMETYDEWIRTGEAPWPWDASKPSPSSERETEEKRQRASTSFSEDGLTVFARLRVDRRHYEFARYWAFFHAGADPEGDAEVHLEGYLNTVLSNAIDEADWQAPAEIEALYPPPPAGE